MDERLNILICDDNVAVHESLAAYLKAENMNYVSIYSGEAVLPILAEEHFDLLILDIMLPKIFGTDICREIRKTSDIPIIMLSAKGEEFDRILGLELGADDYITKPFSPREVIVRIRAILKRANPQKSSKQIVVGEMAINMDTYTVMVAGRKIDTTPRELQTLACLAQHPGKVLSRELLLNQVWGYDYYGDTRAVDTQIKRLRQKLPADQTGFEIQSIYGVGYKLEVAE